MNTYPVSIVTNGHPDMQPAVEFGAWLAQSAGSSVTLLGIAEPADARHPVRQELERASRLLEEAQVDYKIELADGIAEEQTVKFARNHDGLLVLGPFGRPLLRKWLFGSGFRHIMAEVEMPIVYVPQVKLPIRHMLVCLGGLGYALTTEDVAIWIASSVQADLTLLHIVPPINLDYPSARKVDEHRDHLIETDTLPGKNLREALALAREAGVSVRAKIRHGNVIHEILNEIREGDYGMICMGSPYSTHGLRHLYTPNVTAEVAEAANCPILAARYHPEN